MSENDKKLFTIQEAATYLGVSRAKISLLVSKQELSFTNNPLDARQKLISKEQLDRLKTYPTAPKLKTDELSEAHHNQSS